MAKELPRVDLIEQSLKKSRIIVVRTDDEMMRIANEYAPEHLIINHTDADKLAELFLRQMTGKTIFTKPFAKGFIVHAHH